MSNAIINIRLLGGTSLLAAVEAAQHIREKLDCCVEFDFNNVHIFYYGQEYAEVDKEYTKAIGAAPAPHQEEGK